MSDEVTQQLLRELEQCVADGTVKPGNAKKIRHALVTGETVTDLSPSLYLVNERVEAGILTKEDAVPLRGRLEAGENVDSFEMVSDTPEGRAFKAQAMKQARENALALAQLAAARPHIVRAGDRATATRVHRLIHESRSHGSRSRGTSREHAPRTTGTTRTRASSASSSRTRPRRPSADDGDPDVELLAGWCLEVDRAVVAAKRAANRTEPIFVAPKGVR